METKHERRSAFNRRYYSITSPSSYDLEGNDLTPLGETDSQSAGKDFLYVEITEFNPHHHTQCILHAPHIHPP
jgi:hypothetical protein